MKTGKTMLTGKSMPLAVLGIFLLLAAMIPLSAVLAASDPYPTKPVRLVINFAPGGSTDAIGRLIAHQALRAPRQAVHYGKPQPVRGASSARKWWRSRRPTATRCSFSSSAISINPLLFKTPYDPVKSFVPIAKLGDGPSALVVHPSVPANSAKELIALAKQKPGQLIFASAGMGTQGHMGTELFKMMGDIDIKIVQFKSGGLAAIDLIGGQPSNAILVGLTTTLPHIKSGKLRALGYGGTKRTKLMPDLPDHLRGGRSRAMSPPSGGVFTHRPGTPKAIVDRLYKELECDHENGGDAEDL